MRHVKFGWGFNRLFLAFFTLLTGVFVGALPAKALTLAVTTVSDSGPGSLREAITTANGTPAADTITFSIGSGARTISPLSALPTISAPLTIDGSSQPGFAGKPLIFIAGGAAGSGVSGLTIQASNCQVKSVGIGSFDSSGIFIDRSASGGNTVVGCYIGVNAVGTAALPNNSNGVTIFSSGNNRIGGITAAERNVISGNGNGIDINGVGADGNTIQGNYIGTTVAGNAVLPNNNAGIFIEGGANNTTVGGATASARNVISGNGGTGIIVFDAGTDGTKIQSNYIGTDLTGNASLPNHAEGVTISFRSGASGPKNTVIGGVSTAPGSSPGNVISGNDSNQINITGVGSDNTSVQGNLIGTNAGGSAASRTGSGAGVRISYGAGSTTIGGTSVGARNIISGNDTGVYIEGTGPTDNSTVSNLVQGNYIGTNISGTATVGNRLGVLIIASKNNFIGGASSALGQTPGNVIAGNNQYQVRILGDGASNNLVQGNLIGTNKNGTAALAPALVGVGIDSAAKNNLIGGAATNLRNVISGNVTGLQIQNTGTTGNKVQGNYIGTNQAGTAGIANTDNGIVINAAATGNFIGGIATTKGQPPGNVISGSGANGILIIDAGSESTTIQGNLIGTNANGTVAIPNVDTGVVILEGASRNTVGGSATGAGNVISGNSVGIGMHKGATANQVQGNFIGTDISGSVAITNKSVGVLITSSSGQNVIGGTTTGARNIISGNGTGVSIDNDDTDENVVQGNYIGVNVNGAALGNKTAGVEVTSGSFGNLVGAAVTANDADTRAAANKIAFNGNSGVRVSEETTSNATIRGNLIYSNGGLGINLEPANENPDAATANAPTPNDLADGDSGPNHLQNFPALIGVTFVSGNTQVSGALNSQPSTTYVLDFYRSTQGDPSGFGEGEIYLGSSRVTTDTSGNATFTFSATGTLTATTISATATSLTSGETSEFSPLLQSNVVTNTNDSGPGSLRTALLVANALSNTTVRFNIPASLASGGVFTIRPKTPLPTIVQNGTIMDGSTQTAFTGNTNTAGPEIVINGGLVPAGGTAPGLLINGDNCVVRGLVINGFPRGISILGSSTNLLASGNKIEGCYIGTTPAGTLSAAVANIDDGIGLAGDGFTPGTGATNNTIGGLTAEAANVISNNGRYGVVMSGDSTSGNTVVGNFIGTNPAGTAAVPDYRGVALFGGAHDNVIGGTTAAARNLIFGNGDVGIVLISDAGTDRNQIQGNYIGVNKAGTAPLVTGDDVPDIFGVRISNGAKANLIGGTVSGAGNVIAGITNALGIGGVGTNDNLVQGNIIGLSADGTTAIPNLGNGIIVSSGAQNNVIGAPRSATGAAIAAAGNRIANSSGGDGIRVFAAATEQTIGNTIRGNRITSSDGLGINLFPATEAAGTVTPNDASDADGGPNNQQNFPVISTVTTVGNTTTITGTLNSTPNKSFAIDLYGNPADSSACGTGSVVAEGEFYVASQNVTTQSNGNATFTFSVSGSNGAAFTLTATNISTGDSSELTPTLLAGSSSGEVTNTNDSGAGSLRAAMASAGLCSDTVTFKIPQSDPGYNATTGVYTIQVNSPLPNLASNGVLLDGTSQPGFTSRPLIFLNGSNAGAGATGLNITAANVVVKGLIVSGFKGKQINISGTGASNDAVQGSYIGTDATGNAGIAGSGAGIVISTGARNTVIGGILAGQANRIAFNGGDGVVVGTGSADNSTGNTIRGNRIYSNSGLGINLVGGTQDSRGVTANDAGDADTGPNNLQNFPLITGLHLSGTSAISGTVDLTLNSKPNTSVAVDFYRVTTADPSGFGEGEFYLGSRTVTTNASGNYQGTLSFSLGSNFAEQSLTATATNLSTGDTSEFGPSQMLAGTVNTWGYNNLGQLGDGSTTNKLLPQAINLSGVATISAGGAHSLSVKSDGTVWSWGNNGSGQLGDGSVVNRSTPVQVAGLFDVQSVAGGWYHSLALKRDGTVWAWGSNTFGQLGDGTKLVSALPVKVKNLNGVKAIAAGVYYSVALKSDGTVWAWGSNTYGQLGDGTKKDKTTPVQVKGVSGITAIAAGAGHTVLLKSDGTVLAFGWNSNGQLGNGTTKDSVTPLTVSGVRAGSIAAGYAHTLAVDSSGAGVSAWGSNDSGQLGDGTKGANRLTPIRVNNLSGVRLIAAGSSHSLAVKNDGTLWSWGNNIYGAIGDGTATDKLLPVQTSGLANVGAISGGFSHSMALGARAGAVLARIQASFQWTSVSALPSPGTIQLVSPIALDSVVATNSSHYEVTINGVAKKVDAASYTSANKTVTLRLAPGLLKNGDEVAIAWHDLRDNQNQPLTDGQVNATRGGAAAS